MICVMIIRSYPISSCVFVAEVNRSQCFMQVEYLVDHSYYFSSQLVNVLNLSRLERT